MTLADLASIATVISSIAVLGSLIYLALQMRQNTRHTRALIQQSRNSQLADFNMRVAADPAVNELLLRGDAADSTLTPAQATSYLVVVLAQMAHFEDAFYQHREGFIDDERYTAMVVWLQYVRAVRPGFRAAWTICKALGGPSFQAFVDEKIREAASFPAGNSGAQWLDLAAGEHEKASGAPGAAP